MAVRCDNMKLQQSAVAKTMATIAARKAVNIVHSGFNAEWGDLRPWYPSITSLRSEAAASGEACEVRTGTSEKNFPWSPAQLEIYFKRRHEGDDGTSGELVKRFKGEKSQSGETLVSHATTSNISDVRNGTGDTESLVTASAVSWVHSKAAAGLVHIAVSPGVETVCTACSQKLKSKNVVSGDSLFDSPSGSRPWCKSCFELLPVRAQEWVWSQVRQSLM